MAAGLRPTGITRAMIRDETPKAFCYYRKVADGAYKPIWLPKSQCEFRHGELFAAAWLIKERLH